MDANQLRELATNAQLDHWPPHLGVTTDAEKVNYLARQLHEAATEHGDELEAAGLRESTLEDDNADLSNKIDRLDNELEKLRTENEELKAKLA